MAWAYVPSYQSLARHPKLTRLASITGVDRPALIGHLHLLWWWALDYAQDGDLSRWRPAEIAAAAEWGGNPDEFINALVDSGFLDHGNETSPQYADGLRLHDWDEYGGKYFKVRADTAERTRRWRANKAEEKAARPAPKAASNGAHPDEPAPLAPRARPGAEVGE